MATPELRKINMNSPAMKSRVKKYDTYQQRGSALPRRMSEVHSAIVFKSAENIQIQNSSSHVKSPLSSIDVSKPQLVQKTTNQVNPNLKLHNQYIHTQPHQNSQIRKSHTNSVAITAVSESQIFDNEIYPDNEITVYGRAKRKISIFQKALYGFGVLVLVFSAFVSVQSFINNKQAKEQIATLGENSSKDEQGVSEGTGDEPSEDEISQSAIAAFRVSNPQDPRYIRIPDLGVRARVKNLGTTSDGAVDAPKNIYDAGWYNGSVRPGNSVGASLLLAHVSGWTAPGVFKNINKLVEGSVIEVEKGNGEKVQYSVTKKEQLPVDQVNMSSILGTEVAGQHDIKLMTCSGKYNKNTKSYDDRYIVYAKQI